MRTRDVFFEVPASVAALRSRVSSMLSVVLMHIMMLFLDISVKGRDAIPKRRSGTAQSRDCSVRLWWEIQRAKKTFEARGKIFYVSEEAHRQLRFLAARRNRSMGQTVEELVAEELAELSNPWTSREGLWLQQKALTEIWDDPALDVYDND